MSFCGYSEDRRISTQFRNIGEGFLLTSLDIIYSGSGRYDTVKIVEALSDGVELVDRDLGFLLEYDHRIPAELEAGLTQLPENASRIAFREFLRQSKEEVLHGNELPEMPETVRDTVKEMFDRRLAKVSRGWFKLYFK